MNILDNFASLILCFFLYFWYQTSSVIPRAPDLVRMKPDTDPGYFSLSRTSMELLTQKIKNSKIRLANDLVISDYVTN